MVDATELEQLLAKFQNKNLLSSIASNSFENALEKQQSYTVKNTHFKNEGKGGTGVTLGAMEHSVNGLSGELFVDKAKVPYIEPLYYGSKPHIIKPKNKRALYGNGVFYAHVTGGYGLPKEVKHPGYKGNPFIETAYDKNLKTFLNWYSEDMTEELQEAL